VTQDFELENKATTLYNNQTFQKGFEEVAAKIVEDFPTEYREGTSAPLIPDDAVEVMTEITVLFIADFIQAYIDAGSEREATYEDDDLREAIRKSYNDWSVSDFEQFIKNHPSHIQKFKEGPTSE
jgi:hypothetical protein